MDAESETLIPTTGGHFGVAHALTGEGFDASEDGTGRGTPLVPVLPFDTTQMTSQANRSNPKPGDPCHPLAAGAHAPAIAFTDMRGDNRGPGIKVTGAIANTLHCAKGQSEQQAVSAGMQVRRLTPRECERLQGFPDDYTAVPHRGKPAADGPRYKALGNSWAVPCARWIGQRINAVEQIATQELEAA
jgi:DNA (cytosine-5)-methyltransferase 1